VLGVSGVAEQILASQGGICSKDDDDNEMSKYKVLVAARTH
jgi:hypothetical protein